MSAQNGKTPQLLPHFASTLQMNNNVVRETPVAYPDSCIACELDTRYV